MEEVWKPIKGYEGLYEVSNLGNIRSLDKVVMCVRNGKELGVLHKGKVLKPSKRQHGYLGVMLYGRGGHKTRGFKTFSIHRLVAEAFIPNPDRLPEVNHIDEDKTNNAVTNLEWMSHVDNTNYGTTQQRRSQKIRNNSKSKPIAQYTRNGELVKVYPSLGEMRRQTGYSAGNVWHCLNKSSSYTHAYGYVWRYVDR